MRDDQMPTKENLEQQDSECKSIDQELIISLKQEIAELKLEIEADNRNVNALMDQVHELSGQLTNSTPKKRVEALISELNGDISHTNECQHDAIKGFIVDLELFLSNPIESEWMDK